MPPLIRLSAVLIPGNVFCESLMDALIWVEEVEAVLPICRVPAEMLFNSSFERKKPGTDSDFDPKMIGLPDPRGSKVTLAP